MFLHKTFHDSGRAKKEGAVISRIQPYLPHFKIELIATVVLNSISVNLGQLKDKRLPEVVPHTTPLSHLCTAIMCACHHTHTHTSHTQCTTHTCHIQIYHTHIHTKRYHIRIQTLTCLQIPTYIPHTSYTHTPSQAYTAHAYADYTNT